MDHRTEETRTTAGAFPTPKIPAHVRTIRMEVTDLGPDLLEVRGILVDDRPRGAPEWSPHDGTEIHRMEVTIQLSYPDLTITAIRGTMHIYPYDPVCPEALSGLQSLVGVSVRRGFTRAVNERIGREKGCAHVTALVQAMAPVARQGAGAAFHDEQAMPKPEDAPWFINTCQAWRADGPLATCWKSGGYAKWREEQAKKDGRRTT